MTEPQTERRKADRRAAIDRRGENRVVESDARRKKTDRRKVQAH